MRTRSGFVSNSSTSSFIVQADGVYKTVFDLARDMIPLREWNVDEDLSNLQKHLDQGVDPNTPLSFRTCNYQTYIAPVTVDGKLYFAVATCNNHDWSEIKPHLSWDAYRKVYVELTHQPENQSWQEKAFSKYGDLDDMDQFGSVISSTMDFLFLGTETRGREDYGNYHWNLKCPDQDSHWDDHWVDAVTGKTICSSCGKELVPRKQDANP